MMATLSIVSLAYFYILYFPFLQDYVQKFPGVTVLDSPNAIQQLRNRQSMLQDVADMNLPDCDGVASILASAGLCFRSSFFFSVKGEGLLVEWLCLTTNNNVHFST